MSLGRLGVILAGCATQEPPAPARQDQLPGQIAKLLPPNLADRTGWAADIYAAFATQGIAPSLENVCAVLAVTEQESSFRADPVRFPACRRSPGARSTAAPSASACRSSSVRAALQLPSPDGRTYSDRIDARRRPSAS